VRKLDKTPHASKTDGDENKEKTDRKICLLPGGSFLEFVLKRQLEETSVRRIVLEELWTGDVAAV
jgi:hypothetical protein